MAKDAKFLLEYGKMGYYAYVAFRSVYEFFRNFGTDRQVISRKYRKSFGHYPNLDAPQTMNEKIQWLKLYDRQDVKTICADKYAVREWLVKLMGEDVKEHLIPLLFVTDDWRRITRENLPNEPFIIKPNHGSHQYAIVRDKNKIDIARLRQYCRMWLATDHYKYGQEWQYKDIPRKLVVERLLLASDGHIPNDYKLHYFNGKLEFVYCSIGRESENKRNIYDADWQPLDFSWSSKKRGKKDARGREIDPPQSFEKMKEYGVRIAQLFDYVRCDFYDVDGKMYFGEITFHHGGGYDKFVPEEMDLFYGQKLVLTKKQQKSLQ